MGWDGREPGWQHPINTTSWGVTQTGGGMTLMGFFHPGVSLWDSGC